jgi:thymidylate kinase
MTNSNNESVSIKYVSLVGVERCGKGTQINLLKDFFGDGDGVDFLREPGSTALGSILRSGMKPKDSESSLYLSASSLSYLADDMSCLAPTSYFHMMMLQREVLMRQISLGDSRDKFISDRGHMCTYAYQLCAQKLNMSSGYQDVWLNAYKKMFEGIDDLHIILDITPEESLIRKVGRKSSDSFDEVSLDFIANVRSGYDLADDLLSDIRPDKKRRVIMIDAMRSKEEVFDDLRKAIQNHFKD